MPDSTILALGGSGGDAQPDSVCERSVSTIPGGNSWASSVRGDVNSTSNTQNSSQTSDDFGVWNAKFFGRGTTNTWELNRSFFAFDLSGESGTIASADLKIVTDNLGDTGTNQKTVFAVAATALEDSTADFGNVFSSGTTLVSYGSTTITTTNQYHTWTLNSAAITAINNAIGSGIVTIGLMGYYDYNNEDPSSNELKIKVTYANSLGTTSDPRLELTLESAAGYTHKVVSVAAGSIGKVNGVATANIGKVNSVD